MGRLVLSLFVEFLFSAVGKFENLFTNRSLEFSWSGKIDSLKQAIAAAFRAVPLQGTLLDASLGGAVKCSALI